MAQHTIWCRQLLGKQWLWLQLDVFLDKHSSQEILLITLFLTGS